MMCPNSSAGLNEGCITRKSAYEILRFLKFLQGFLGIYRDFLFLRDFLPKLPKEPSEKVSNNSQNL